MKATFASTHYTGGEYSEVNPGVFVSHGRIAGGVVRNSYREISLALGARGAYSLHRYVRVSASIGVATGYGGSSYDIGPKGLVLTSMQSVAVGPPRLRVLILHVPGAVAFGLQVNT